METDKSAKAEKRPSAVRPDTMFNILAEVVTLCINKGLLDRQRNWTRYNPELAPVGQNVTIVFAQHRGGDTVIGDVTSIHDGAFIDAGVLLHPHAVIGKRAKVGPGAEVGSFVRVGDDVTVGEDVYLEEGANLLTGCSIGDGSTIGSGAEVNHDLVIPADTNIEPGKIVTCLADLEDNPAA